MDEARLKELAVKTLGKAGGKAVDLPEDYLVQLKSHLKHFPHDHNFLLTPHAGGEGLGTIRCLETACQGTIVVLGPRTTRKDGGRSVGIGAFGRYQSHIQDSDPHEPSRDLRVSREKKAALAAKLSAPRTSTSSTGTSPRGPSFKDLSNSAASREVITIDDDEEANSKPLVKAGSSNGTKRPAAWTIDVDLLSSDDDKPNPKAAKLGPSGGSGSSLGSVKHEGPSSASPAIVIDGASPERAKKLRSIKAEEQRWDSLLKVYMANPETAAKLNKSGIEKAQAKIAQCKQQLQRLRDEIKGESSPRKKTQAVQYSSSPAPASAGPSTSSAPGAAEVKPAVVTAVQQPGGVPAPAFGALLFEEQVAQLMAKKKAWTDHYAARPSTKSKTFTVWQHACEQLRITYQTINFASSPEVRLEAVKREEAARRQKEEDVRKGAEDFRHKTAALMGAIPNAVASGSGTGTSTVNVGGTNANAVASGSGAKGPLANVGLYDRYYSDDLSDSDRDSALGGIVDGLYLGDGDYGVEGLARDRDRDAYDAAYGSRFIAMSETERRDFFERAVNEADFSENATVQSARAALGLTDAHPKLKGMSFALLPHQIIGVDWAVKKETKDRGGLLGDEMGLGKTIQMTAMMILNVPGKKFSNTQRSTLIVAPLALLRQWKEELVDKTSVYGDSDILIYHASGRKPKTVKEITKYAVVITTFSTMALEWPDPLVEERRDKKRKAQKKAAGSDGEESEDFVSEDTKKNKQKLGPLFLIDWYRVVLDEAHNIRNRRTRVSRAAADLTAEYRWCLSGTPIVNAASDVYGYVRFIGTPGWREWSKFNAEIAKIEKKYSSTAARRLQVVLKTCMLRRKKDSKLDGKPLIELPAKTIENLELDFSPDERELYQAVEARAQAQFNKFLKEGTVLKNYSHVLVLLLRLRQLCAHPALITEYADNLVAEEELAEHRATAKDDLRRAQDLNGIEWTKRMQQKCQTEIEEMLEAEKASKDALGAECPICSEPLSDDARVTPCPNLGHVFCKDCMDAVFAAPNNNDDDVGGPQYRPDERLCPTCRHPFALRNTFLRDAFMPAPDAITQGIDVSDGEGVHEEEAKMGKGKGKGKAGMKRAKTKKRIAETDGSETDDNDDDDETLGGFIVHGEADDAEDGNSDYGAGRGSSVKKGKRRQQPKRASKGKKKAPRIVLDSEDEDYEAVEAEAEEEEEEEESEAEEEKPVWIEKTLGKAIFTADMPKIKPRHEPSAKMIWLAEEIERIFLESPTDKVMILSQWTSMLDLIDVFLASKGYDFCRFQGDMNASERHEAVRAFQTQPRIKIMLMSLKAGGVGLNLTSGNRCISLDLAWSPSVEAQAQDRLHRLGQTKEVIVKRVMIAQSVEQRICDLQNRKQNMADNSFGEGKGKRLGRLTVGDLITLFSSNYRPPEDHAPPQPLAPAQPVPGPAPQAE